MVYFDPYSAEKTMDLLSEGWFTDYMPDLNQRNKFVANYLIQNTIWWIEYSGIDGIREDTYPYSDQEFLSVWAEEILNEYPRFNIVGEVWTGVSAYLAPYQANNALRGSFNSHLPAITDFALRDALYNYLQNKSNLYEVYGVLAKDYLYPDQSQLVTFIDNHDIERVMYAAGEDKQRAKIALAILLTTRGIPQILYGTEIGMVGSPEHGILRSDFPGGFPGDDRDAFSESGRTESENELFKYLQSLLSIRRSYKCLSSGRLTHYPPNDNIYIYTRKKNDDEIIIIVNGGNSDKYINPDDYDDNIFQGEFVNLLNNRTEVNVAGNEIKPYEVKILLRK
jgi:glycosidase